MKFLTLMAMICIDALLFVGIGYLIASNFVVKDEALRYELNTSEVTFSEYLNDLPVNNMEMVEMKTEIYTKYTSLSPYYRDWVTKKLNDFQIAITKPERSLLIGIRIGAVGILISLLFLMINNILMNEREDSRTKYLMPILIWVIYKICVGISEKIYEKKEIRRDAAERRRNKLDSLTHKFQTYRKA